MHEFLNGVYLEVNENLITTFSSDGERFALAYDYLEENNNNVNIILPKQTINEVINLTELTRHVYITITKKYIRFISNNTTITSKLIKDIYELPDLNIEQDLFINIELEKHIIKKSLYKINFFIKENKITFEFEKNNIKFTHK
ncbi:MAG TPA: DNA polymerase III subunit beta family protein [Candidatus Azoamicus sp.]